MRTHRIAWCNKYVGEEWFEGFFVNKVYDNLKKINLMNTGKHMFIFLYIRFSF